MHDYQMCNHCLERQNLKVNATKEDMIVIPCVRDQDICGHTQRSCVQSKPKALAYHITDRSPGNQSGKEKEQIAQAGVRQHTARLLQQSGDTLKH